STKITPKDSISKDTTKKESVSSQTVVADATTPTEPTSSQKHEQKQQATTPATSQARGNAPSSSIGGNAPSSSIEAHPQGKPEMPSSDMAWGPEKMVQLTERLRWCGNEQGARFSTQRAGKTLKSQRDRQIEAARKILAEIPGLTEADYLAAYNDQ